MNSFRLEAPRSSNKVRKRTISGTLNDDDISGLLDLGNINSAVPSSSAILNSDETKSDVKVKPLDAELRTVFTKNINLVKGTMSLPADDRTDTGISLRNLSVQNNIDEDEQNNQCSSLKDGKAYILKYDESKQGPGIGKIPAQHRTVKSDFCIGSNSKPTEWVEEIDALKLMKNGTSFLKYGKWGAPHFRPFRLSQDNSKIIWSSKNKVISLCVFIQKLNMNKSKDSTQIDIKRIDKILTGQNTTTFQRHASPELARASFSVVYDKYKTLDVIARNQTEHNCWIQGLNALIEAAKKEELEQLSELVVRLKMTKIDTANQDDNSLIKSKCSKERAVKDFTGLSKIYNRLEEKSQSPKMIGSEEFEIVSSKLESLKTHLELIEKRIDSDDLVEVDFLLWQASVEIESIDNILLASKI